MTNELLATIELLRIENKQLKEENELLKQPIIDNWENANKITIKSPLQQRIDKALEYINCALDEEKETPSKNDDWALDLLEILKGE